MSKTEIPSIRFHGFDDAWEQRKLSELIIEYKKTVGSDCTLPILTSSKTEGVIFQEDHFGRKQNHDITGYNILPRNYCTYRNRSDGVDFTFNINRCCDKGIISKFYPVFYGNNCDIFFISLVLNNSNEVVREIGYTCTGTGQKVLSFLDLQKMKIRVPKYEEQKRIASYIETLDNLITLHQSKYEKLQAIKASMLEKMFPKDGAVVPEVRFKGFTDPWEQRKLGEMGQTYTGLSGKTKDDFGHGQARFVTYMNVFSNPISNPEMTEPIEIDPKQNEVEVGDVFFTTSSETPEEVGMSSILLEKRGKTYLNSFCFGFRPSEKIDSYYLAYMLRSESTRAKIILLAQGISRYNISKNKVMEIAVSLPSLDEQKMIGQYFSQLDNLITLHQRELEKLQSIKKALLEKMFV